MHIELVGSLATSGPHKLDNAPDNFTRGKADTFLLATRELGAIGKVRVTLAAAASGTAAPEWHLDAVHVLRKLCADDAAGEPLGSFYHRDWVQPRQVRATQLVSRTRTLSSMHLPVNVEPHHKFDGHLPDASQSENLCRAGRAAGMKAAWCACRPSSS